MKININDIGGNIAKEDDRYIVKDNTLLKNLVLSSTTMKPGKSTSGHIHKGQEEVYYFIKGKGTMYLDDVPMQVGPGDVVLIEDGVHHRVESDMYQGKDESLYFVCVFDGKRSH